MRHYIYENKRTGKKIKTDRYITDRNLRLIGYKDQSNKMGMVNTQMNNNLILQKWQTNHIQH